MEWLRKAIVAAGGFGKVAEVSGISVPHLYAVCRGERAVTAYLVVKLAPVFPRIGKARWNAALMQQGLSKADRPAGRTSKQDRPTVAEEVAPEGRP